VHPSLSEGFGLAVLEGMCAGLPIIASAIPGVAEALGDTGLTIEDPVDDRALANAILGCLHDPEEARRMAERGRTRAEAFTWERTARRTLAVYRECLGVDGAPSTGHPPHRDFAPHPPEKLPSGRVRDRNRS